MAGLSKGIRARVDEDQKKLFRRKAASLDMTESELLRAVVIAVIGQIDDSNKVIEPDANNAKSERITFRLPRFLKTAIERRAKARGNMTATRWIKALIQSNLIRVPVMTDAELFVLHGSNRELAAIGRNLNQIARVLNRDSYETEQVRLEKLNVLSKAVADNREAIRALIKASQNAWEAD